MGSEEKYFSGNISGASVTGNMTAAYFSGRLNIPSGKSGGNYEELSNKPRINGVELLGDRSFSELGFPDIPDMTGYAKLSDIPSRLPADGGDADTVGGHTVKADVPENAVFTDTVPDLSGYAKNHGYSVKPACKRRQCRYGGRYRNCRSAADNADCDKYSSCCPKRRR